MRKQKNFQASIRGISCEQYCLFRLMSNNGSYSVGMARSTRARLPFVRVGRFTTSDMPPLHYAPQATCGETRLE